jgi:glycosyltransferase involved in cell wall biosynthesis
MQHRRDVLPSSPVVPGEREAPDAPSLISSLPAVSPSTFINGRFLEQRISGVQRFAREIVGAAGQTESWSRQAALLVPGKSASDGDFEGIPILRHGACRGHAWEQAELSRAAGDSLLLNLCNSAPLFRRRQVVVLHDAAVAAMPRNFTPAFRLWYQLAIRCYGRTAVKLGTVSKFSADEIAKHFGIGARNIEIVGESGEHILRQPPDYALHRKFNLDEDGYFLAASNWAPNKNFLGILRAVSKLPHLRHKFVIVGGRDSRIYSSANFDVSGAIEVGYASDAQLRALYERAACFVYPSLYEGFGLPPLEAMCCGCPVLVSDASAMPEICGGAAVYCNPNDVDDIARQLAGLLGSRDGRAELRAAGLARAKEWTWKRAARDLSALVEVASAAL